MAQIMLTEDAQSDLLRLREFLAGQDMEAAGRVGGAIADAITRLKIFPESAPPLDGEYRVLSVPFGRRGYSVAYIYEQKSDTVIILGVKHQSEEYFPFEFDEND